VGRRGNEDIAEAYGTYGASYTPSTHLRAVFYFILFIPRRADDGHNNMNWRGGS